MSSSIDEIAKKRRSQAQALRNAVIAAGYSFQSNTPLEEISGSDYSVISVLVRHGGHSAKICISTDTFYLSGDTTIIGKPRSLNVSREALHKSVNDLLGAVMDVENAEAGGASQGKRTARA